MNQAGMFEKVAAAMRHDYPETTAGQVREVWDAMERGEGTMPHGIIGMFARDMLGTWADLIRPMQP